MWSKSSLRQAWLRASFMLAVCAVLVVLAYPAYFPQPIIAQQEMRGRSEAGDLQCVSYCSTTQPGTVLMEVKWRLADRPLSEADLRSKVREQGLEVTVYSEGFERGLFASVPAIKANALFRTRTGGEGLGPVPQSQRKIPGLQKLLITDVATRLEQPAQSFHLLQSVTEDTAEGEWVTIRLQGLDPGLGYTYRVRGGRSVVTCQTVVCPNDQMPTPRNRAKRKPRD